MHILFYYCSLINGRVRFDRTNATSWHFAEAASFFIFLVLAPVGLTEYLREEADQTAIQQQHQIQQLEIEALKRKIEALLDARNKID